MSASEFCSFSSFACFSLQYISNFSSRHFGDQNKPWDLAGRAVKNGPENWPIIAHSPTEIIIFMSLSSSARPLLGNHILNTTLSASFACFSLQYISNFSSRHFGDQNKPWDLAGRAVKNGPENWPIIAHSPTEIIIFMSLSSSARPLLGNHILNTTLSHLRECKGKQPVFVQTIMTGSQASRLY